MRKFKNAVGDASGLNFLVLFAAMLLAGQSPPSPSHTRVERAAERAAWEVTFPDDITMEEYARQLDYFGIEIAAVSPDDKVESIARVSQQKPQKRVGRRADDERLYIGWKSGTLHAADRRLLLRAGINSNRKELIHYFPAETQRRMQQLERAYAGRDPREIHRTRFEIRKLAADDGYEFVVMEQDPPRDSVSTSEE
jgi:hypothetical protein